MLAGHDWGARTAHAAAVLAPERVAGLVTMATAYGPMHHLNAAERFTEAERAWYRYWLCTDAGAERFAVHPAAFIRRCWADWSPSLLMAEADLRAVLRATETAQFIEAVVHYYRHGTGAAPGRPRYAAAQARLDQWPRIASRPRSCTGWTTAARSRRPAGATPTCSPPPTTGSNCPAPATSSRANAPTPWPKPSPGT